MLHRSLSVLFGVFWLAAPTVLAGDFSVSVDPRDVVATQSDWFHGINSESDVQDRYVTSPGSEQAMRAAGFEAARFPGGIPSDYYDWSCPYWVDHKIGQPGECPSGIDEVYFDEHGNVLGDVWQLYATGGVIDNPSLFDDRAVSGPEFAYLDCLENPGYSSRCSHYNTGRASTSDFWAWMTGFNGNPHVSAPVGSGVSPADFVHVAGPPQRPMNGFGARRMLAQTNVFGLRPLDLSYLQTSELDAIQSAPNAFLAMGLVPQRTPNRGAQHAGRWAASIHRAGIDAFYEVGNEPDGYLMFHANRLDLCPDLSTCNTNREAYLQASMWLNMYIDQFALHVQMIRNHDPGAKVFGPAAVSSTANLNGVGWYVLEEFARRNSGLPASRQADGLSFHYYPDGPSPQQQNLFFQLGLPAGDSPLKDWISRRSMASLHLPWVLGEINARAQPYGRTMPLVVSEWHIGHPHKREQNRSYGLALATLDVLAAFAHNGIEAHQFHSLHTTGPFHSPDTLSCDPNDPDCYALRPADGYHGYGLLSGILDQFGGNLSMSPRPPDTPTATYYAMSLWQHMGAHTLGTADALRFPLSVFDPLPPRQDEVAVHVHRDFDENVQILVINKTSQAHSIQFDLQDYTVYGTHHTYWSIDPLGWYSDSTILSGQGSLFYNGSVDPSYHPGLPAPRSILVLGNEVNLHVPAYGIRLVHIDGEISTTGGIDPPPGGGGIVVIE